MGLQVRLRHALGERLMDLADRPPERPLVVGRAREADLKIPSVSVATEHCALFVHEGAWVVQDTSGGSTWVNGEPIATPTPLYVGDVISLGNDASPATIEVDPAGVAQGRTGEAALSNAAAPVRSMPATPRAAVGQAPARQQGGYYQAPAMSAPPAQAGGYAAEGSGEQGDFVDWNQPAGASAGASNAAPSYRRRKKQQSSAPLFLGVLAGVVIIGGPAWFAYTKLNPPPPPPPAKVVVEEPVHRSNNVFDDMNPSASVPKARHAPASSGGTPTPVPPKPKPESDGADAPKESAPDPDASSSAPPASAKPSTASTDGHADEKAWQEVESAHYLPDQAQAIMKFDDYRRQHPNDAEKELTAYTDFALNQLWWQRVAQLVKKRDTLMKAAATHARDLRDEPNPAFKKTLAAEKQEIDTQLAKTVDFLNNEMAYTGDEVPDITDAAMIEKLSATRDADKYGAWKTRTARFIRSHHGATPWAGDD
jgi:hypothetical protein